MPHDSNKAKEPTKDPYTYAMWAADYFQECMRRRRSIQMQAALSLCAFDVVVTSAWVQLDSSQWMPWKLVAAKGTIVAVMATLLALLHNFLAVCEYQTEFDRDLRYVPLGNWLYKEMRPLMPDSSLPEPGVDTREPLRKYRKEWARTFPEIAALVVAAGCAVFVCLK